MSIEVQLTSKQVAALCKLTEGLAHHDCFGPLSDEAAVFVSDTGESLYELPYSGGRLLLGHLRTLASILSD